MVLTVGDLDLPEEATEQMRIIYDVVELATALKPTLIRTLLERGFDSVAYVDPDIEFFAPIDDVLAQAVVNGIVLTPHVVEPFPRDGKGLEEGTISRAGIFNLGFIAVGPSAMPFLSWWEERAATDAIADFDRGLFTDQRWIDWVPVLFPPLINRDRGLNVAHWNLHERPLTIDDDVVHAGGSVLRFFHFSGFDPNRPELLSRHQGSSPRILLSEDPIAQGICARYADRLHAEGFDDWHRLPYGYAALSKGLLLTSAMRRAVRDVVLGVVPSASEPPEPFTDPDGFAAWLRAPGIGFGVDRLTPLEYGQWSGHAGLRSFFPNAVHGDALRFRDWLSRDESMDEPPTRADQDAELRAAALQLASTQAQLAATQQHRTVRFAQALIAMRGAVRRRILPPE
jgi:hypothetical protein